MVVHLHRSVWHVIRLRVRSSERCRADDEPQTNLIVRIVNCQSIATTITTVTVSLLWFPADNVIRIVQCRISVRQCRPSPPLQSVEAEIIIIIVIITITIVIIATAETIKADIMQASKTHIQVLHRYTCNYLQIGYNQTEMSSTHITIAFSCVIHCSSIVHKLVKITKKVEVWQTVFVAVVHVTLSLKVISRAPR